MKSFFIALTLWAGTIILSCAMVGFFGLFTVDGYLIGGAFIGFFVVLFISCPLLLPTTGLIHLAAKIPYSNTAKLYWLGSALLFQNFLFFRLFFLIDPEFEIFFYMSAIGVVIMLIYKRTSIKNYFSQQTTKKIL